MDGFAGRARWIKPAVAACILGAGLCVSAQAGATIVVASSGPSAKQFPAGRKLADDGWLVLREGDSVTVLDQRGTKVLRGPGRVAVQSRGAAAAPLPATIFRTDSAVRERVASVRTDETGDRSYRPDLWQVDVTQPGTRCLIKGSKVDLWRSDTRTAARYTFTAASGAKETVDFTPGAQTAPLNAAGPGSGKDASFSIAVATGLTVGRFKFVTISPAPAEPEALVSALIQNGCTIQLKVMADALAMSMD